MSRWNDDPYTKRAQRENYEARSIYKLKEIDKRERIFQGVSTVIDLGASPGSWCQYALERIPQTGRVIAVDLSPLNVTEPRLIFIQKDINEVDFSTLVTSPIDLVLSDMAPKTSGIHDRDVALSFELATMALEVTKKYLKKNGTFVVKLFMGESFEDYQKMMRESFTAVRLLRPETTRKHSREIYFIGKGFK